MSHALIIMLAVMGGTMLLRAPISFGMLAGGIAYLIAKGQDVGLMAEQVLNGLYNSYVLLAVPLFILAASIMNAGAISEKLFAMAIALVGHFRGGLAYVNVIVSVIFSGMSGSAIADAAGPGLVSIRMMTDKNRFTPEFAGALTACSSTIGPDHSAIDSTGHLCPSLGHLGGCAVPGGRHSWFRHGTLADDRDLYPSAHSPLPE